MAEPKLSKSSLWCPMTNTISAASMRSKTAWATTRAFTRVCFSTALDFPPKNWTLPSKSTATWSPPLPNTKSRWDWARAPSSSIEVFGLLWIKPILKVTGNLLSPWRLRTLSKISNFSLTAKSRAWRSKMITYISSEIRRSNPPREWDHLSKRLLTSNKIDVRWASLNPCITSSWEKIYWPLRFQILSIGMFGQISVIKEPISGGCLSQRSNSWLYHSKRKSLLITMITWGNCSKA